MPANTGENKTVMVIDGQQRLTTLSVLIKAIYDLFEPEKKAIISGDLKPYLFYKQRITDENHHVKIIHSRIDSEYYKQIIGDINNNVIQSLKENDIENINSKSNNVINILMNN